MKIIFSRKGFDSGPKSGRVASPILPSGTLYSLPIPEPDPANECARPYGEIQAGGESLGKIVADLTGSRIAPDHLAHLDPDLEESGVPRQPGWKPLFGQVSAAESHLRNQGVGPGDLFLFFGWFRNVEMVDGRYRYKQGCSDKHVLFGWLQVEKRIQVSKRDTIPEWALGHPHTKQRPYGKNDSLYVATENLHLGGQLLDRPGAGLFRQYRPALCLTEEGESRSIWALPADFYKDNEPPALSYHNKPSRWSHENGQTRLKTVGRGQEFVLDCGDHPAAIEWVKTLFAGND